MGTSKDRRFKAAAHTHTTSTQVLTNELKEKKYYEQGAILLKLHSPELNAQIAESKLRLALLEKQLTRAGTNAYDLSLLGITREEFSAEQNHLHGLERIAETLIIRAPFAGIAENLDPELQTGMWLSDVRPVAIFRKQHSQSVIAFVEENKVLRLSETDTGKFFPDGSFMGENRKVVLAAIAPVAVGELPWRILSDLEGGLISVVPDDNGRLEPRNSWYRLRLVFDDKSAFMDVQSHQRGIVVLDAQPQSFASRVGKQVASILIRESGF